MKLSSKETDSAKHGTLAVRTEVASIQTEPKEFCCHPVTWISGGSIASSWCSFTDCRHIFNNHKSEATKTTASPSKSTSKILPFFLRTTQTNSDTQKSPLWACDKGCAEVCAERFSLPKMRRRQLKTRNHVVEEKKHVNPNLLKKICSVDDNFGPPKRYVVRSGM